MAYSADSFACLDTASGVEWPGVDGGVMALIAFAGLEMVHEKAQLLERSQYGLLNVMQCKV